MNHSHRSLLSHSFLKSDHERFAPLALFFKSKIANRLFLRANRIFALLAFAHKTQAIHSKNRWANSQLCRRHTHFTQLHSCMYVLSIPASIKGTGSQDCHPLLCKNDLAIGSYEKGWNKFDIFLLGPGVWSSKTNLAFVTHLSCCQILI